MKIKKIKKRYSRILKRLVGELILEKEIWNGLGFMLFYIPITSLTMPKKFTTKICLAISYKQGCGFIYNEEFNSHLKILFNLGLKERIEEILYG